MSKIKLSFSFLLAMLFVGILSTAAFAAGSTVPGYNPQVTTEGSTIQNGLTGTDQGNDNSYDGTTKSNANKTGVGVGGQTANFNQVIKAAGTDGTGLVSDNLGNHKVQRTHGEYMNNTNSCASCHQTHTGASEGLLFKDGAYATCTACHDGTLGFYNVYSTDQTKSDGSGWDNSAGTFGGTHDGNMSAHLANGTVALSAAPGGNNAGGTSKGGEWTEEFTCASCHAPHGSYSDRLLNEDPNGMANTGIQFGGTKLTTVNVVADITTKDVASDISYVDATGTTQTYNYIAYRFVIGDPGQPALASNPDYTAKGLTTGDTVLQIMKWDGSKYVNDTAPWLHEYDFDASHNKLYWSNFKTSTGSVTVTTDMLKSGEILGAGYVGAKSASTTMVTAINNAVQGQVARSYVVKLDITPSSNPALATLNVKTTNVASLWASKLANGSTNTAYKSGRGVAMSTWCASCHTDYLASSGKETGTFDHAYRHTTTSDSYTCIRCHYAHGTDATVMRDARGKTYQNIIDDTTNYFPTVLDPTVRAATVKDYLMDKNPSSALKRYTNMAVCWACHTSSHSGGTRNTDSYQYNPTAGVDTDRNGIEFDY